MIPAFYALGLYAGLLGLIWIWLTSNTGRKRGREKVSIGDGGNIHIIRAMRGHANFVESAPLALIILMMAAVIGTPVFVIHISGVMLVLGRFLHAYHFIQDDAPRWQRAAGMILTTLVIAVGSIGLIGHAVLNLT
jgi:uncharacterized membrane protein YecN with MAPEG domain